MNVTSCNILEKEITGEITVVFSAGSPPSCTVILPFRLEMD
jgi:hypothetical protein